MKRKYLNLNKNMNMQNKDNIEERISYLNNLFEDLIKESKNLMKIYEKDQSEENLNNLKKIRLDMNKVSKDLDQAESLTDEEKESFENLSNFGKINKDILETLFFDDSDHNNNNS
ncbi:MAG: hypothetical protein AM1032_000039 [Mycoplasmataceae bacterium]|nr:MAG: hypothetical protein AM1032_000039 [Mycoplasmataceae bacterium]